MAFVLVERTQQTPSARLILRHLAENLQSQTYSEIAAATQTGYWHTRRLCLSLAKDGLLVRGKQGRSPAFSIAMPCTKAVG